MSEPIRVAVLGFGLAGRVFHCPFVSAVPGLTLAAIVQRSGDQAAEAYPGARILRSAEAAFDAPDIDLIVVGTPNETHQALALAALRAGKHVVVDKPMTPSSAAAATLIRTARDAGKQLFPFHNRRWDGDFLTIQHLLAEGTLGRLNAVHSQWDRFRPYPRANSWKEAEDDANGLLQDLGPHLLDGAIALFGPPQRLTAGVRRDRENTGIEDGFDILLEFDRPSTGITPASTLRYLCGSTMIAADPAPRFRLNGTNGSYTKYGVDPQEAHLVAGGGHPPRLGASVPLTSSPASPSPTSWLSEPESAWGTLTLAADPANHPSDLTRTRLPTLDGDYRLFYAGVRDALLGTAPAPVTALDAWRVARLIELARESSRERQTLKVHLPAEQTEI